LILHGTHDALVPLAQSEELAAVLQSKGVPVWLQRLPGSGHGGPAFSRASVVKLTKDFFAKYLKKAALELRTIPEDELAVAPPKTAGQ
jgi:dipeptidyl aminopeptidase/acylaminoacyl peptidase